MGSGRRRWWVAFALALSLLLCLPRGALAGSLTADEHARLERGEVVKRPLAFELEGGRYVGGIAYTVVRARPDAVMAVLGDVSAYASILPLTLEAREIRRGRREAIVALRHGGRFGTASYAMRIRRAARNEIRFWLEQSLPHDVEDAFGFFRIDPLSDEASLLTYAAVVDLGFGFTRMFFETRVRDLALDTPALVKAYVESRASRSRRQRSQAAR